MLRFDLTDEAKTQLKAELQVIYEQAKVDPYIDQFEFQRVLGHLVRESLPKEALAALAAMAHDKGEPFIHIGNLPVDDDISAHYNLAYLKIGRMDKPHKSFISEYVMIGLAWATGLRPVSQPQDELTELMGYEFPAQVEFHQIISISPEKNAVKNPDVTYFNPPQPYHSDRRSSNAFMVLYCLQQQGNAKTSYITANDIVAAIVAAGRKDMLKILQEPIFYSDHPGESGSRFSILTQARSDIWHVSFAQRDKHLTAESDEGKAAIKFLNEILDTIKPSHVTELKAGEAVISSNLRGVHRREGHIMSADLSKARWTQNLQANPYTPVR